MQIIYVEENKLHMAIDEDGIFDIQKSRSNRINPLAIRVRCLDVTTKNRTYVDGDRLRLDAWALVDFSAWLHRKMPEKFCSTFYSYFPGSADITDVASASARIVAQSTLRRPPQGDERHYIAKALASNPEGFATLAKAWAELHKPS